jgi:hypothetical protein
VDQAPRCVAVLLARLASIRGHLSVQNFPFAESVMDWFRLYEEFATDPKVQMMSECMQRRLIMLMCFTCKNGNVSETFHETEYETSLAFYMRISIEELNDTKTVFLARRFVDEQWSLRAWNKRQYVSDSSTARVRDFRARQKGNVTFHETSAKRSSNAPEQNRTEQKKDQKQKQPPAVAVADEKPVLPDWVNVEAWDGFAAMRRRERHPLTARASKLVLTKLAAMRDANQDPTAVLDQSTRNGWRDVFPVKQEPTLIASANNGLRSVLRDAL